MVRFAHRSPPSPFDWQPEPHSVTLHGACPVAPHWYSEPGSPPSTPSLPQNVPAAGQPPAFEEPLDDPPVEPELLADPLEPEASPVVEPVVEPEVEVAAPLVDAPPLVLPELEAPPVVPFTARPPLVELELPWPPSSEVRPLPGQAPNSKRTAKALAT